MTEAELQQAGERFRREMFEASGLIQRLGYKLTEEGVYRSLLLLDDGYSPAEVAMTIMLFAFAREVRSAPRDLESQAPFSFLALEIIELMGAEADAGRMDASIFRENATLFRHLAAPGPYRADALKGFMREEEGPLAVPKVGLKKPRKWWPF